MNRLSQIKPNQGDARPSWISLLFVVCLVSPDLQATAAEADSNNGFSGEIELGYEKSRVKNQDGSQLYLPGEFVTSVESDVVVRFGTQSSLNISYSHEFGKESCGMIDRLYLRYGIAGTNLLIGRLDDLFSSSKTEFLSTPLTEFGEVQADTLALGIRASTGIEFTPYLYRYSDSPVTTDPGGVGTIDTIRTGAQLAYRLPAQPLETRLEYVNALTDHEGFEVDENVSAIYAGIHFTPGSISLLIEYAKILEQVAGESSHMVKPYASSVELSIDSCCGMIYGIRSEFSSGFEDLPKTRNSVMATLELQQDLYLGVELSRSEFRSEQQLTDDGVNRSVAIELSVKYEF